MCQRRHRVPLQLPVYERSIRSNQAIDTTSTSDVQQPGSQGGLHNLVTSALDAICPCTLTFADDVGQLGASEMKPNIVVRRISAGESRHDQIVISPATL